MILPGETVRGVFVLNHHMFIYGPQSWVRYSMRGEPEETQPAPPHTPYDDVDWEILCKLINSNKKHTSERIVILFLKNIAHKFLYKYNSITPDFLCLGT